MLKSIVYVPGIVQSSFIFVISTLLLIISVFHHFYLRRQCDMPTA